MDHSHQLLETVSSGIFRGGHYSFQSQVLNTGYSYIRLKLSERPHGTLYLLHGGSGDEKQLIETDVLGRIPAELAETLKKRNIQIVLPYIGKSFLHQHPTLPEHSYSDLFFNELLPAVEADTDTKASSRWIAG